MKRNQLLKEIKEGLFGRVPAMVHTIEFQKRGLPHMHLLIFRIVSAQLPDPQLHSQLYHTVTNCMLHGPCGNHKPNAPCMVNGNCSKHYPKEFLEATIFGENGYPQYKRPNNGRTVEKNGFTYDNRWTVISMLKFVPVLNLSNIYTNTSTKAMIGKLWFLELIRKEMRPQNIWMVDTLDQWKLLAYI